MTPATACGSFTSRLNRADGKVCKASKRVQIASPPRGIAAQFGACERRPPAADHPPRGTDRGHAPAPPRRHAWSAHRSRGGWLQRRAPPERRLSSSRGAGARAPDARSPAEALRRTTVCRRDAPRAPRPTWRCAASCPSPGEPPQRQLRTGGVYGGMGEDTFSAALANDPPNALPMPFRASVSSLGTIQSLLDGFSASLGSIWRYW